MRDEEAKKVLNDLCIPLNSVSGYAKMMSDEYPQEERLSEIIASIFNAQELIKVALLNSNKPKSIRKELVQ